VSLKTDVTEKYLRQAFEFSVNYQLNPHKAKRNRTSGQDRSLGEIVDSFITGKVIELGVIDILRKINPKKKYVPDLKVRDAQDYGDPDIVAVNENGSDRQPKVFVETKNDSADYRWTGLFKEQFETMQKHPMIKGDLNKIFIVYASVKTKKEVGISNMDLFGVYLKKSILSQSKLFKGFVEPSDLSVEINHVITGEELLKNGDFFEKERDSIFETDVLKESTLGIIKKDGVMRKGVKKISFSGNKIPIKEINDYPKKFGDFYFVGKLEIYRVQFRRSISLYLRCISDVKVQNKLFGKFSLKKGKQYQLVIKKLMPCGRNNLWIAKRKLDLVTKPIHVRMKEIAEKI